MTTIAGIATSNTDFSILVSALTYVDSEVSDANLVATLSDADQNLTVFAPTNSAFGALATDLGFVGDATDADAVTTFLVDTLDAETLQTVILYHVSAGRLSASDIAGAGGVNTLQGGRLALDGPTLVDAEPDLIDGSIATADIAADNGVVHVVDRVLLPVDLPGNDAPSIAGLVSASGDFDTDGSDFDLLLAAVGTAGLVDALADPDADLTVFAPNDAAFVGLAQTLGFEGDDEAGALAFLVRGLTLLGGGDPLPLLTETLLYHVSAESLQASQVLTSETIATLQGGALAVDGAMLQDADPDLADPSIIATDIQASNGIVHVIDGVLLPADVLASDGNDDVDLIFGSDANDVLNTGLDNDLIDTGGGNNMVMAGNGNDIVLGGSGSDRIDGGNGDDLLRGGDGADVLIGGSGADMLYGGTGMADLRDRIFAGDGNDMIDAGYGNDQVFGQDGNDSISGGFGSDELAGQDGNDVIGGNALADAIFGNDGDDFLNGGWGHDLINGGQGADRFYHQGIESHGSDWIQDFASAEGDILVFGQNDASADDFVLHFNDAVSADGVRSGNDDVQEAFVDYRGQVVFALVDGADQDSINIQINGMIYDLLA